MLRTALVTALLFAATEVRAADLPAGTWAANVDGSKSEFVITQVKDGRVSGSLQGTDFTGTWNGKNLTFRIALATYSAHLVTEKDGDGKIKYTLTGTCELARRVETRVQIHVVGNVGWYAQITAKPVVPGEIRATVRGVLTFEAETAYVSVKTDANAPELKVWFRVPADQWAAFRMTHKNLSDREVIATGKIGPSAKAGGPALDFLDVPEVKQAPPVTKPEKGDMVPGGKSIPDRSETSGRSRASFRDIPGLLPDRPSVGKKLRPPLPEQRDDGTK